MENQDIIYTQFKNASEKLDDTNFPNNDKIWNRIEVKLDAKVLKKQNNLWKKIAVAASIFLVVSVAYQLLKPTQEIKINSPQIVTTDSVSTTIKPNTTTDAVVAVEDNAIIKKDAIKILDNQINDKKTVVVADDVVPEVTNLKNVSKDSGFLETGTYEKSSTDFKEVEKSNSWSNSKKYVTRVVHNSPANIKPIIINQDTIKKEAKLKPLLVLNGNAVTSKKNENYNRVTAAELSNINPDELKTVIELKEPLYIINGETYTEKQLFGPNPTSPYAPLNIQEIESTIVIEGKEAIEKYGKMGEKGVVIIKTKNGKPLKQ